MSKLPKKRSALINAVLGGDADRSQMSKLDYVFFRLLTGESFNRFEAERVLNDHCLHSTVAQLQTSSGVSISRKREAVKGFMGKPTSVCRYWIEIAERKRIIERIEGADKSRPFNNGQA